VVNSGCKCRCPSRYVFTRISAKTTNGATKGGKHAANQSKAIELFDLRSRRQKVKVLKPVPGIKFNFIRLYLECHIKEMFI